MNNNPVNPNLPKLEIPSLFDSPKEPKRLIPNPTSFTTESSLEEPKEILLTKTESDDLKKKLRTTEIWFG